MDIFLTLASLLGGSIVSNSRESGTPSNDGEGSGTYTRAYDTESKVPCNINLLTSFNHFHFRINGNVLNSAFERQTIFISLRFKVFFWQGWDFRFHHAFFYIYLFLICYIFYPVFFYILPSFIWTFWESGAFDSACRVESSLLVSKKLQFIVFVQ